VCSLCEWYAFPTHPVTLCRGWPHPVSAPVAPCVCSQSSKEVVATAIATLMELLVAVDVNPAVDKPSVTVDALHGHVVAAAEDISRQAAKASLVLKMKDVDAGGRAFVCTAVTDAVVQLVSGCQYLCLRCGTTKAREVKKLARCVAHGLWASRRTRTQAHTNTHAPGNEAVLSAVGRVQRADGVWR
jgi:hypothetical protein